MKQQLFLKSSAGKPRPRTSNTPWVTPTSAVMLPPPWPGPSCCLASSLRATGRAMGIIWPRPRGGPAPDRAGSGHGAAQCFVSWQRRLGTWHRSRWRRRRRPWRRPTLHPRCRRRRGAEARPRAETSTGCVPSWPEVGVRRWDPGPVNRAAGGGQSQRPL